MNEDEQAAVWTALHEAAAETLMERMRNDLADTTLVARLRRRYD